ncbi:HNH endonuclease family protein [Streptomyces sp. NPDC002506]|uniref:HNH endonuclease family protein n=1 Tax=Streptomyces sp. NPDC002506 TaxID=3154536 RepID=UPI00331EA4EC
MRVRLTTFSLTTATALSALTTLLAPAAAAAPQSGPLGSAGDVITMPTRDALAALPIQAEDRTGYQRTAFKHWIDADKDGCNTRAEVLKRDALLAPQQGARCALSGGRWYSTYDDQYLDDPKALDIDHRVPLAEAWDSGAGQWTATEREAYANDLGDRRALVAVSAKSNRSKADQDPATWMPPFAGDTCEYVTDWIAIKVRWQLSIDPTEQGALDAKSADCPNTPLRVTLAR